MTEQDKKTKKLQDKRFIAKSNAVIAARFQENIEDAIRQNDGLVLGAVALIAAEDENGELNTALAVTAVADSISEFRDTLILALQESRRDEKN